MRADDEVTATKDLPLEVTPTRKGNDAAIADRGSVDGNPERKKVTRFFGSFASKSWNKADDPQVANPAIESQPPVTTPSNDVNAMSSATAAPRGPTFREVRDRKVVGLKDYGLSKSTYAKRQKLGSWHSTSTRPHAQHFGGGGASVFSLPRASIEDMEEEARELTLNNPVLLMFLGITAAVKVMFYFLITLETMITCIVTVGLTCFWYFTNQGNPLWSGRDFDFILVAFAVISPISAAIAMAYTRRERALIAVGDFRSVAYHLYLAHCTWDWPDNGGRAAAEARGDVVWIEHCDAVLAQLIAIGDELSRLLSLPTATKSRHRMTRQGRREAARIMEVSYHLLQSMCTQRMTRLMFYSERLKKIGLPAGEMSRVRQYERFISYNLEQLRMVKLYRTPQSLRSFARIFTLILPPFYSPAFAQVARGTQSLAMGILFGIITALGLSALFEGLEILEDPFTAYLALDGIDVTEEFDVLHFAQLVGARKLCFPDARAYPPGRRAALVPSAAAVKKKHLIGQPPTQSHHPVHHRVHSRIPSQVDVYSQAPSVLTDADDINNAMFDPDEEGFDADHVDLELGTLGDDWEKVRDTAFFAGSSDGDATMRTHKSRSGKVSPKPSMPRSDLSRRRTGGNS